MNTTDKPQPDSHFCLLPCKGCRSDNVAYKSTNAGGKTHYAVKCLGCGQRTPWYPCKHDAQGDWNGRLGGKNEWQELTRRK